MFGLNKLPIAHVSIVYGTNSFLAIASYSSRFAISPSNRLVSQQISPAPYTTLGYGREYGVVIIDKLQNTLVASH